MTATNATIQPDLNAGVLPQPRKRRIPSERNRRVYVEVVLAERPQPEVAKEFGVTQQRVSQIIEQFQAWLAENLPQGAEAMSAEEQLRLAANTAYLRQEHLLASAMRKFDQSCEDKHSLRIRYSAKGDELWREKLRENQTGKSGYLGVALNATVRKWKLVQMAAGLLGPAMEVFWDHGESVARQPDRFRCERSERIVSPAASAGQAAAADPPPPTPSGGSRQPLCNSGSPEADQTPVAPPAGDATSVAASPCTDGDDRKSPPQDTENFLQKSCAASLEEQVVLPLSRQRSERVALPAEDRR
ncbi:MAG TPA: hypothetical protein VMP01_27895, partial [Pirellulaceae bacterium]|nr:hypothetical protein [Pirellulaceae bacterium]